MPQITRRLFVALVLFCAFCGHRIGAADRPNVLLILVDDLKPSFGAYGQTWVHSPNLDRLATSGMRCDMAYCNQAVCAPSRNNLLTGARSTSLGVYSLGYNFRRAVPDAVTMPQYFKQHGYHCFPKGNRLGRAIRTDRYRLVEWKPWTEGSAATEYELYDYQCDALETKNLVETNPGVVARLAQLLATHPPAVADAEHR